MADSQVVDLNVGGRHLTTSLSTLTKYPDSMLATMFSGRHPVAKDKDGRYFIDVDGDVFVHILNFLRFGKMPPPERASQVNEYAEYFGLEELRAPVLEDFEQVLYGIWKKKLPGYQGLLDCVKIDLKRRNIFTDSCLRVCPVCGRKAAMGFRIGR
ncbi:BTB/POZ domain-containing protein KCTD7-like isoform X3 [Haliotis rufescens]|uniref:BTB/POZ domain-containing protein KCTD7-like isoform X3 n=1 Tax=Haliotis rufescens TaxID=6454 RepID=UPI00201E8700|nr:BTB/POZ domain-containing protein KCTD7-like isoform X3 [Haliotis rufescens]